MLSTQKLLTEKAEDNIIRYISDHELKEGDKLPNEYDLAALINVSRSTLREAVKTLVTRNILEVRHGSGTYVGSGKIEAEDPLGITNIKDAGKLIYDLFEVRYLIEPKMTAMAAQNSKIADIRKLERYCLKVEESLKAGTPDHIEYDTRFHSLIAEMSGNQAFMTLLPIIYESIYRYNKDFTNEDVKRSSIKYHRQILEAIKEKDVIEAHDAAMLHIVKVRENLLL